MNVGGFRHGAKTTDETWADHRGTERVCVLNNRSLPFCSIVIFQIFTSQAENRGLLLEETECHLRRDCHILMFGGLTQICSILFCEAHRLISDVLAHVELFTALFLNVHQWPRNIKCSRKPLTRKRETKYKKRRKKKEP